jgi:hypothetical protein
MAGSASLPLFFAVLAGTAALIGRPWAVALAVIGVPVFYAGLAIEWWGVLEDDWQYDAVAVGGVALFGCWGGAEVGSCLGIGGGWPRRLRSGMASMRGTLSWRSPSVEEYGRGSSASGLP